MTHGSEHKQSVAGLSDCQPQVDLDGSLCGYCKANGNYMDHFSFSTEVSKLSITRRVGHTSLMEIWKAAACHSFAPCTLGACV